MLRPRRPGWLTEDQDGTNVFIPGLMGAGLLVSVGMLLADGVRRLDPLRTRAARERAILAYAEGRVRDLHAVAIGTTPVPPRLAYAPRSRAARLTTGGIALGLATAAVWWSIAMYHSTGSVLSDRAWTVGAGVLVGLALALPGLVLLASGALGRAAPGWLTHLAGRPPLGRPVGLEGDPEE
jgi:hypothetical protein